MIYVVAYLLIAILFALGISSKVERIVYQRKIQDERIPYEFKYNKNIKKQLRGFVTISTTLMLGLTWPIWIVIKIISLFIPETKKGDES